MAGRLEKLQFVIGLIDRLSNPLTRIQARLHAMGLEQMALFRTNFHAYGNSAAAAARKVTLITAALTAAIAATGALVAAMTPMVGMAIGGIGAALGTANTAGVSREMGQLEQTTGMNTGSVQMYRQAGRMVGMDAGVGEVGDIGKVFGELHEKLQAPNDSGLADVMKKIKLPLKEIKGMKPDQLLQRVTTQMEKLGMSDVKKSQILEEMAGDASKLLPLLGKNADALARFSTHSTKVGAIITPQQAALMKDVNREWAMMKTGAEGYGNIMSEVGGNFMKLFGPEINTWFEDNADGMRRWAASSSQELNRLHKVFKVGGLRAVYEDLFPNLSAFTLRVGAFVSGFSDSFATPFMATVRDTWARVSAVLGNTAGGAKGLGAAIGASILPVFSAMMEALGDAVIFLEKNWDFVKQLFAWSPLGLVIDNWGSIKSALEPVGKAIKALAEYFGLVAPGVNESGSALGSLFGFLTALAGVVLLNKLAFGAVYHVVKLFNGVMTLLKASTMIVTVVTKLYHLSLMVGRGIMIAWRLATLGMVAASYLLQGGLALLTSPIGLVVAGIALLVAGAIYLYNHWAQVSAYLGETSWGRGILSVIDAITHPMESLGRLMDALSGWWSAAVESISSNDIGAAFMDSLSTILDPAALFELFQTFMSDGLKGVFKSVFGSISGEMAGSLMPMVMGLASQFGTASTFLMQFGVVQRGVAVASGLMTYGLAAAKAALLNFSIVQKIVALSSTMMAGAMAVLTAPITLIIVGLAALAAGAYYLYTHWAEVKSYLGETSWGQTLLAVFDAVMSPVQLFNDAITYLSGLWASTKASLAETTWGQMILDAINILFSPFELFQAGIAALQGAWGGIKASLADTSWGQAIMGAINMIMGAIDRFKAGWASLKSAASEQVSGAWGSIKAAVGMGESSPASGGGRAVGGLIRAGVPYQVNERVPEILMSGGKTWVMNDTMARISPLTQLDAANSPVFNASPLSDVSARAAESQSGLRELLDGGGDTSSGGIRSMINNSVTNRERMMTQNSGKRIQIGSVAIHIHGEADAEKILHELEMVA